MKNAIPPQLRTVNGDGSLRRRGQQTIAAHATASMAIPATANSPPMHATNFNMATVY